MEKLVYGHIFLLVWSYYRYCPRWWFSKLAIKTAEWRGLMLPCVFFIINSEQICINFLTVCSYHVTYAFQSESTFNSCLIVKEPLERSRREIWSLSDYNWTRTDNHFGYEFQYVTLCLILQFQKREKHPNTYGKVLLLIKFRLKPATLLRVALLHGCFSRLLSCTNSTIPCKISHIDLRRHISDPVKHLWRLPTKWPNTLKQFVGKLPTNCLSMFDHFVKLTLKGLNTPLICLLSQYSN